MLAVGIRVAPVCAADNAAPAPPDLTAGGVRDDNRDWVLGPTGLRGWIYGV